MTRVYLVGGASAVLCGWRENTLDVDFKFEPEREELLRALENLKEELSINVELAYPGDFIPMPPGWQDRSLFIASEGTVSFFHCDFYAQALAKLERGHGKDTRDVREMIQRKLVETGELLRLYEAIEPELYRFPALDKDAFRKAVVATGELGPPA